LLRGYAERASELVFRGRRVFCSNRGQRLGCGRTFSVLLSVNDNLKNRVTYSVLLKKLAPDSIADFIRAELDKAALAHCTFSDDALGLIVRSSEDGLRKTRNLCLSSLLEAVRDRTKVVELKQVNRVLLQPHWRKEVDLPH
jgi:MSHA biogenesis protein MshM